MKLHKRDCSHERSRSVGPDPSSEENEQLGGKPNAGKGKGKQPRAVTLSLSELSAGLSLKDLNHVTKTLAVAWDPKTLGYSNKVVLTLQDGSCTALIEVGVGDEAKNLTIAEFNAHLLADSKPFLTLSRAVNILTPLLSDAVSDVLTHQMENLTSHTEIQAVLSAK
eukprot:3133874-Amphidinium_carterae.1